VLDHESRAWAAGCRRVAGVDEAGRGPLAGPVVAAAVVFDPAYAEAELDAALSGLTDSKRLPPKRRQHFFDLLYACGKVEIGVGMAEADEIDAANILVATHRAMKRALEALPHRPDFVFVDGLPIPDFPFPYEAVVRGDSLSLSVAAASIVAKVTRDRIMDEWDRRCPAYGFARHKGYGTKEHLAALAQYGPAPCHRRSFQPVVQMSLGWA
jgi:ribonuclease HII